MKTPVSALLARKSVSLVSVEPKMTALQAVQLMNKLRVGCVVVMQNEQLVGIFTERDVLRQIVAAGLDAGSVLVADIMSSDIVSITPDTQVGAAMDLVNENKIRHLPVLEDGVLVGIISAGDLNKHLTEKFRQEAGTLMSYLVDNGLGV